MPKISAKRQITLIKKRKGVARGLLKGIRYFGFVNGGVMPVVLAARWLSDVWDQNAALYVMSPLTSKLEEVCESWLKQLFDLPDSVVAGFVSGSSLAIFCGLVLRAA